MGSYLRTVFSTCQTVQTARISNSSGGDTVWNVLTNWIERLSRYNISEPVESVKIIVAHILGVKNLPELQRIRNRQLSVHEIKKINRLCEERLQRKPVQYIIKEWDFRNLNVALRPPIFIPRPETEQLVDIVLREVQNGEMRKILEIGCGSGAICLSLLKHYPQLEVTAIDKNVEACELTEENAVRNGIHRNLKISNIGLSEMNYSTLFERHFDIIVSNPPYIPTKDLDKLQPEITLFEDIEALHGGTNGLDIIKLIFHMASFILKNKGKIFLEVDPSHPTLIQEWLAIHPELHLSYVKAYKDFCGKYRFVEVAYGNST